MTWMIRKEVLTNQSQHRLHINGVCTLGDLSWLTCPGLYCIIMLTERLM